MTESFINALEPRQFLSAAPSSAPLPAITPAATETSIEVTPGKYKGSTVSNKGFTTRLTMTLGKQHSNGTIIGTFDYLEGFDFTLHLRIGADNTFHATIATGNFSGTLIAGEITTADHDTIIDLSGRYTFSNGKGDGDSGHFLVRS